jgi:hypothetical protein
MAEGGYIDGIIVGWKCVDMCWLVEGCKYEDKAAWHL